MSSDRDDINAMAIDPSLLPVHVAIIMDGNGRWAQKKLMNRVKGHEKGAETVRNIVTASRETGIKVLTLYAFSTENWMRPKAEVSALMTLLVNFLKNETDDLDAKGIRLTTIGETEKLPDNVKTALYKSMEKTSRNSDMVLCLALSYGGRNEILSAVKKISEKLRKTEIDPSAIDENLISTYLFTNGLPDPDLMIRTSGEKRISNFLLWQLAYAELFFTDTLWPDFTKEEYLEIIKAYTTRDRRFGKI